MPYDEEKANEIVTIEFKWEQSDIPTHHVNQLLISHAGPEFYLIFGEVIPVDVDHPMDLPKTLKVEQRVRVAIPREVMGQFLDTMNQNYATFIKRINDSLATEMLMAKDKNDNDNPVS